MLNLALIMICIILLQQKRVTRCRIFYEILRRFLGNKFILLSVECIKDKPLLQQRKHVGVKKFFVRQIKCVIVAHDECLLAVDK